METIFQRLNVYLKGGQTITIDFKAEDVAKLNPQIDAFLSALGEPEKKEKNFLFQGARVALVRLSDVSAAEAVSLILKENGKKEETGKTPAKK